MASNEYHYITTWSIRATPDEIIDVLGDAPALARWWPSVYLEVNELEPGDERGVGKRVELYTKGWLPYTLRWRFRVTEADPPTGFRLEAEGDFVGRGIWTLRADAGADAPGGPLTTVTYDWLIARREGPPSPAVADHEAGVRRQSPLGDGARRREPQDRARSPSRNVRPDDRRRDPAATGPDVPAQPPQAPAASEVPKLDHGSAPGRMGQRPARRAGDLRRTSARGWDGRGPGRP